MSTNAIAPPQKATRLVRQLVKSCWLAHITSSFSSCLSTAFRRICPMTFPRKASPCMLQKRLTATHYQPVITKARVSQIQTLNEWLKGKSATSFFFSFSLLFSWTMTAAFFPITTLIFQRLYFHLLLKRYGINISLRAFDALSKLDTCHQLVMLFYSSKQSSKYTRKLFTPTTNSPVNSYYT